SHTSRHNRNVDGRVMNKRLECGCCILSLRQTLQRLRRKSRRQSFKANQIRFTVRKPTGTVIRTIRTTTVLPTFWDRRWAASPSISDTSDTVFMAGMGSLTADSTTDSLMADSITAYMDSRIRDLRLAPVDSMAADSMAAEWVA